MKNYVLKVTFKLEDFWFDNYEFQQTEEYFLEKLIKIIDKEMHDKYGCLTEGSCFQVLFHFLDTGVLDMQQLIEDYADELKEMCMEDIKTDCYDSGAYADMEAEAEEYERDLEDWFGTKNDVLGL